MHMPTVKKRSLSVNTPDSFSLLVEENEKKKMHNPLTFDSLDLEADLTDAMLFPTSWDGKKYQNALLISQCG